MGSSRNGEIYELGLVNEFYKIVIKRNGSPVFIDVGANTGSFAFLPSFNKKMMCYAFEPNIGVFNILKENIRLNDIEANVIPYNKGIWSRQKQMLLKVPIDKTDSGLSTFGANPTRFVYDGKPGAYEEQEVECITIDDFVEERGLMIDAIKVDTEGAELYVLKGAEGLLRKQKPFLLFEYDNKNTVQFGYERDEIVYYLKDVGYTKFKVFKRSDMFAS